MQRTITGTGLKDLKGNLVATGRVYANPVGVLPGDPATMLVQGQESWDITNGAFTGSITGGALYEFYATEISGSAETVIVSTFRAPVTTEAGEVQFWELRLVGAGLYIPPEVLANYQLRSERGQANGYAPLGADGLVPGAYLPEGGGGEPPAEYLTETEALALFYPQATVDGFLAAKSNTGHGHAIGDITNLGTQLAAKADLVAGVIPTAQLPAIAILDVYPDVATQGAMLALPAQRGDMAIRTDTASTWILAGPDPATLADWVELPQPVGGVISVNGQNAVVVLGYADVGAAPASLVGDVATLSGTVDGHTTDIGSLGTRMTAAEAAILALEGGGGPTNKSEYFTQMAALLEPRLLYIQYGFEKVDVPANETWFHQYSWNLRVDNHGNIARFENRNVTGGPVPIRGLSFYGQTETSHGNWIKTTGVTYADGEDEYYRKLLAIQNLPTRYVPNSVLTVNWMNWLPGPNDSMLVQVGDFDKAWTAGMGEIGDFAGATGAPAPDDVVHQEFRDTNSFLKNPVPVSLNGFPQMGGGKGFDWGTAIGQPASPGAAPVGWMLAVNLPASYHGVDTDVVAPAGYLQQVDTVGGLPAGLTTVVGAGGLIRRHPVNDWLEVTAGTTNWTVGWYYTLFNVAAGLSHVWELVYDDAAVKHMEGLGTGTGIAHADFTHAIEVSAGVITVHHDAGSGRTSRTFADFNVAPGHTYRFRITLQDNGRAYYEMQTTFVTVDGGGNANRIRHQIGSRDWYDLLEGTEPATGAGFAQLRIKGSSGGPGTLHMIARPRIANAHAGATNERGWLFWDDMEGMPFMAGYASAWALINGRKPGRIQKGTEVWAAGANSRLAAYGEAHNNVGVDPFTYDPGVADIDHEFNIYLPAASTWGYHKFNWDTATNSGWVFQISSGAGFAAIFSRTAGASDGNEVYIGTDGNPWVGTNPAPGAGWHKVRIKALGNRVQTWLDDVALHDVTITNRPHKTLTEVAVYTYDDSGVSRIGRVRAKLAV